MHPNNKVTTFLSEREAVLKKLRELEPERSAEGLTTIHEGESRQVRRNRERLERKALKQEKREFDRRMEIREMFQYSEKEKR